jgi:hypothetical protein
VVNLKRFTSYFSNLALFLSVFLATFACAPASASLQLLSEYTLLRSVNRVPALTGVTGNSHEWLLRPMEQFSDGLQLTVLYTEDLTYKKERVAGLYNPIARTIEIEKRMPANLQALTLAHELAHAFSPKSIKKGTPGREIFAETVACLVMKEFGLNAKNSAFLLYYYLERVDRDETGILQSKSDAIDNVVAQLVFGIRKQFGK